MTSLTPLQLMPMLYAIVAIRARIQPLSSKKEAKISSLFCSSSTRSWCISTNLSRGLQGSLSTKMLTTSYVLKIP